MGNTIVDYFAYQYTGNQITGIFDYTGTQNSYNIKEYQDKNHVYGATTEMAYDANGNLTKDLDRDIVTIRYNLLNLPEIVQFKNGNQIRNLYDAGGQKLSTRNYTVFHYFQPIITIGEIYDLNDMVQNNEEVYVDGDDYLGNIEYKFYDEYYYGEQNWNGINLKQVNNPEGFFNNSLDFPIFNYFRRDHLGNNREVWRAPWSYGSTNYAATTTQRTQYYPSGLPWASNSGDNPWVQNKKYNDKEFIEMHGLDEYDSEARWFYPAIMRTTTIDPLAEKYYSISPYAWCGNNPIIAIDPTGEDVVIWYKDTNSKSGMSSYRYSGGEVKSTNSYVRKVVNALNYNINNGNKAKNGGGDPSKTAVNDHSLSINIYETDYQSQHDPGNNTVYWNPELGTETENGIIRSPASVMDHELDHAIYKL